MSKQVQILGKKYKYNRIEQLASQLKIGDTAQERKDNARAVLVNIKQPKLIYNTVTGAIGRIDLTKKPIIYKEFLGIKRLDKRERDPLLTGQLNYLPINSNIRQENRIVDDINLRETRIKVHYRMTIRIWVSADDFLLREVTGIYIGAIGDIQYIDKPYTLRFEPKRKFYEHDYYEGEENEFEFIEGAKFGNDERLFNIQFTGLEKQIVDKVAKDYNFVHTLIFVDLELMDNKGNDLNLEDMILRMSENDDISVNLFNEVIEVVTSDNSCVITYLDKSYGKKINVKLYFKDFKDGVSTKDIIEFCKKYNIKCIAYDINCNIIKSYIPDSPNKNYKALIFIAYNNHIYPIKNKFLNRKEYKDNINYTLETDKAIQKRFNELIEKKVMPSTVKAYIDKGEIIIKSFIDNDRLYICNPNYNFIKNIMSIFGIEDKITPDASFSSLMRDLEKLYDIKDTYSFFPEIKEHTLSPCRYLNTDHKNISIKDLVTIDKRKMYGYCLSILPYIPTVDIRTCDIIESPTEILTNYIYYAEPKKWSTLMENANFYDADYLLFCESKGIEFKLIKGYECTNNENKFNKMIDDYYTKTEKLCVDKETTDLIKFIINMYIGCFEKGCEVKKTQYVSKICNNDEASRSNEVQKKYNDNYTFCFDNKEYVEINTRKLISMQIKNMARRVLYEKMEELQIESKDIIQINTDSVTYIRNNIEPSNINTSYKGWKYEDFKVINYEFDEYLENTLEVNSGRNNNELHLGYAGCGKTYKIKNNIVPELKKQGLKYMILSPNHSAIEEYRKEKLNCIECNVIQYYEYNKGEIPDVDTIIIDEIGLCDKSANDIIFRFHLAGIRILAYGDYEQLYPVKESKHFNNKEYLNNLYRFRMKSSGNYRNNFTTMYYDSLINEDDDIDCIEEVKKHMIDDYLKADAVVCISNKKCDEYNEKIMNHFNLKFGDIGFKAICKTNKLRDYEIYNNFILIITDNDGENIKFNNLYSVPIEKIKASFFKPGYARTLYNVQGKTLNSYYVPQDELYWFRDGRRAYTLISRLKQEVNEKPKIIKAKKEKKQDKLFKISFDNI